MDVQSHLDDEPDLSTCRHRARLPDDFADQIARAVTATARDRGLRDGAIEVAVVSDPQIRAVNRHHLQHDWETDVISFPYSCHHGVVEGELMISWDTALRQAPRTGWPPMTELLLYAIHGALHLSGMDDIDVAQRSEMRRAERRILDLLRPEGYARYDVDQEPSAPDWPSEDRS